MSFALATLLATLFSPLPAFAQTAPPESRPSPPEAHFWFGVRAWMLTINLQNVAYGTQDLTGDGATVTVATGGALGLNRRYFVGFELAGGLTYRFLWARAGLGVGWDVQGKTHTMVTLDGTPGTVTTSGIASAISVSAGVALPGTAATVGIGPFFSYVFATGTFDPGGAPQGASGHIVAWGGEAIVERRLRNRMSLSTTLRIGVDLSVQALLGLSFE